MNEWDGRAHLNDDSKLWLLCVLFSLLESYLNWICEEHFQVLFVQKMLTSTTTTTKMSESTGQQSLINRSIRVIIIPFLTIWMFIQRQFNTIRNFIFSTLNSSPSTTTLKIIDNNNNNDNDDDQVWNLFFSLKFLQFLFEMYSFKFLKKNCCHDIHTLSLI